MFNKFLALVMIAFPYFSGAQIIERVTIKAGEDVTNTLSKHGLYLFHDFTIAEVKFKNGTSTKARMNFNVYMNKAQFIGDKGDTLALSKVDLVDSILFDSATFYYQGGYKQVIEAGKEVMLVLDRKISFDFIKKGGYDTPAPAGATTETIEDIYFAGGYSGEKRLIADQDIIAIKKSSYLIIYDKTRKTTANSAGFQLAFPEKKKEIKDFSAANNINYKNEEDIKKVFKFCVSPS
jgi:hypothetical protein